MAGMLTGRTALVTGASSGIGEATAAALARAGARVAVQARRADRLDALVRRIEAEGGEAFAIVGDAADEATAYGAVTQTVDRLGGIDILVNSAGVIQSAKIEAGDPAEYRRVMDINLMATVYTCMAAVPHMKAKGSGHIVNISSLAGRKVAPIFNSYSASKFALNAMTDALRQEVGGMGIRVTILMPGATSTEVAGNIADPTLRAAMTTHVGKEGAVLPEDVGDTIVFLTAMPQRANISEITIRPTIDVSA